MKLIARALERLCWTRPARIIESGNKPYLYRIFLFRLLGWNCYLHHFVSADAERWLHDHPFDGLAIVVSGSYVEERLVAMNWPGLTTERRTVRFLNWISGNCFHRILKPLPHTWTLFIHSPKFKGWGFLQANETGIEYLNPFGNVGLTPWWRHAPTYGYLRQRNTNLQINP